MCVAAYQLQPLSALKFLSPQEKLYFERVLMAISKHSYKNSKLPLFPPVVDNETLYANISIKNAGYSALETRNDTVDLLDCDCIVF